MDFSNFIFWQTLENPLKVYRKVIFRRVVRNTRQIEWRAGYFMDKEAYKGENIYHRKDGRWEGRYAVGRKSDGGLKYGYVYGKSHQSVKERLLPLKQRAKRMMDLYGKSLMNYREWINQWKKEVRGTIKESTFSSYSYKLNRYLLPFLGKIPIYQITSEKVLELIDHLMKYQLSVNSIHIIIGLFKKTLNDAKRQELLFKNPCDTVILPKRNTKKVRALTLEQQQSLVDAVNSIGNEKAQAVTLALNTGMRIGEIAALTWDNIDFSKEIIFVEQTCHRLLDEEKQKKIVHYDTVKSLSSNRIIPMNQKVVRVLKRLKKVSTSRFVFSINDRGCEPRVLTYYFHQVRRKAKLNHIHFHQLRHTFATRCLEAKVGITSVSALLGHSSTKMTLDVYSDSMISERITAVHAIEQLAG